VREKIGLAFIQDDQDLLTQKGFTLLEILVSVAITAIVLVLVYGSFSSSFTVSERISDEREFFRSARLTMSKVSSEIEAAYWREEMGETLFNGSHSVIDGYSRDSLIFTSLSHYRFQSDSRESDLNRLAFRLEEDIEEDTVFFIHEEEFNLYSLTPKTVASYRLGEGFKGLQFRYYDGKEWQDHWDASHQKALPKAVEIEIILEDIKGRDRMFTTKTTIGMVQ